MNKGLQLEVWPHYPSVTPWATPPRPSEPKGWDPCGSKPFSFWQSFLMMWSLGKQAWGYWVGEKKMCNIYIFNSINTAWRCSLDRESRAWPRGWVIRWPAAWSQQLSLCMQRPEIQPACGVSWTETGETLHRTGCPSITWHRHICTRAELASGKAQGQANTLQGVGLPSLAFPQDLKITLCTQVVHVLAFYLLQRNKAIDCLSRDGR